MVKFFKLFTKLRLITSSLNGNKIEPYLEHFQILFFARILWLRLQTVLKQKIALIGPSSMKVALLIGGSSAQEY